MIDKIVSLFKQYWVALVFAAIAVRQLIIWDWFGAIVTGAVAVVYAIIETVRK